MKTLTNIISFIFCIIIICSYTNSFASSEKEKILLEIKSYINNLKKLRADFIQVNPNGYVREGKLYLDLPGKIRLEYTNPDNLLITSQGFWLVVQDRELKYTNNIPVSETPLDFFLNKQINFSEETSNISVKKESGLIFLTIQDKKRYHQSTLVMQFTENPINLKKWIIKDEFENHTSVLLQNLNLTEDISHLLFFPEVFETNDK